MKWAATTGTGPVGARTAPGREEDDRCGPRDGDCGRRRRARPAEDRPDRHEEGAGPRSEFRARRRRSRVGEDEPGRDAGNERQHRHAVGPGRPPGDGARRRQVGRGDDQQRPQGCRGAAEPARRRHGIRECEFGDEHRNREDDRAEQRPAERRRVRRERPQRDAEPGPQEEPDGDADGGSLAEFTGRGDEENGRRRQGGCG
ncbi:hypothetical protein BRC63_09135 [Halobacteriales archaeon QH_10_70_21]|nr:MAG: hypothetical protein BRC63_09135 [Halobacteriales archaeon QH_10_70_21]